MRSQIPGETTPTRQNTGAVVVCWSIDTIDPPQKDHFGTITFRVSFTCYLCASPPAVPTHQASRYRRCLQGSILGPWLAVTHAGITPARLRSIAKPLPMAGLLVSPSTLQSTPRDARCTTRGQRGSLLLHCHDFHPLLPASLGAPRKVHHATLLNPDVMKKHLRLSQDHSYLVRAAVVGQRDMSFARRQLLAVQFDVSNATAHAMRVFD
jgi:hypothetical protein